MGKQPPNRRGRPDRRTRGRLERAAIGAGGGAVASVALIEITADSPEIRFDARSNVTVSAKTQSSPALTEFASAAPTPKPAAAKEPSPEAGSHQPDIVTFEG